jgi:hypothetical protein
MAKLTDLNGSIVTVSLYRKVDEINKVADRNNTLVEDWTGWQENNGWTYAEVTYNKGFFSSMMGKWFVLTWRQRQSVQRLERIQ